jgi:Astacin (Peptidase family M12A)
MRFFIFVCFAAAALTIGASPAPAHTVGGIRRNVLPPPFKVEMEETEKLAKALADDAPVARGVINTLKLWPIGHKLSACFFDGEQRWKEFFVEVSKVWTTGTSLAIDFGPASSYAACDKAKPDDIRISFVDPSGGAWSFVGTDSRKYHLDGASLNVDYPAGKSWEAIDKKEFAYFVLHELGHALALEHEHQSPEANCDAEFDWPKVYKRFVKYGWDQKMVDFNLRTLVKSPRLRTSPYDKTSIMHYYYEPELFTKGTASSCYVGHNLEPSATDLRMIRKAYPSRVQLQNAHLQERADTASVQLASLKLGKPQLSTVGLELKDVLARFDRPFKVEFNLTSNQVGRGPAEQALQDCSTTAAAPADKASCGIAADGLQLVIRVNRN